MNILHTDNLAGLGILLALAMLATAVMAMRADARLLRRRLESDDLARRLWSRSLADASFDGMLIHRQGLILQMNHALVRMLGIREREWLGQHFANLARPELAAILRAELEAPQTKPVEFHLLRSNKTEIAVEMSSQTIDYEGQPATVTALRDITQRLADAATITRLTHYDALTGLANRKRFGELLEAAVTTSDRQGTVTVFTIDLDKFKTMNEQLGRAGGDLLLKQIALRISAMAAKGDVLARLGGDKFALLLTSQGAENRALSLGGQLAAAFNEPFIVEGQLVKLALSIGVAVYPDHAADAEGVMKASAFALAQAQRAGGAVVHMYCHEEAGYHRHATRREEQRTGQTDIQRLGGDLRAAIARGEMKLVYQPVFNTADLTLSGFEALARWNHPVEGIIAPDRFIPIADAAGLTHEIGCYLIERACMEAVAAGGVRMAVNISSVQLRDVNFPARIAAILRKTGLKPEHLEIEVTEALLVEHRTTAATALQGLQTAGVGIALDDFGTGYSSMSSLCNMSFTRLKIDRRFVQKLGRDPNADAIVNAILTLAGNLRLQVTAMGVESEAQLDYLRRHGCHAAQGPLLAQPSARALARPPALNIAPVASHRPALVVSRE